MATRVAVAIRTGLLALALVAAALGVSAAGASSLWATDPTLHLPGVFSCPVPPTDGTAADCS